MTAEVVNGVCKSGQCRSPSRPSGYCILHDPDPRKNEKEFLDTVRERLLDTSYSDANFVGCVFYSIGNVFEMTISRYTDFSRAHFHCMAEFSTTKFNGGCSFGNAVFHAGAHFGRSCVIANASFREAEFRKAAKFDGVVLRDYADFSTTTFSPGHLHSFTNTKFAMAKFEGTRFLGVTTFKDCSFTSTDIAFVKCDLIGLRVLGIRAATGMEFEDVTWPRKQYGKYVKGRRIIADEVSDAPLLPVLNFYRHLHRYYYERSEFDLASDFYVSFMVIKRKTLKGKQIARVPSLVYSWLSRYGESLWRPVFALVLIWTLATLGLLCLGIRLEEGSEVITQRTLWDESTTGISATSFFSDFWKAFQVNFSLTTLFRSNALRPALSSLQHTILLIETLFNALLAGFLAVAVRRSFAPKKPL